MKIHAIGGMLVVLAASIDIASAANRPDGYVALCNEGKTCSVAQTTNVAFGRADKFFFKTLSGSFACSAATFGGRVAGGTNECSVPKGNASSSAASSGSSKSGSSKSSASSRSSVSSSTASSSSSKPPAVTGSTCTSTGTVSVSEPIAVTAGAVFDGGCKTYIPSDALEHYYTQNDPQAAPVFRLGVGATLKNVIIGGLGADGVHVLGDATVDNVNWLQIGVGALYVKGKGTVTVRNVSVNDTRPSAWTTYAFRGNAESTLNVSNCIVRNLDGAFRQNGGTTYTTRVSFNACRIENVSTAVFRTESTTSTASLLNSTLVNTPTVCLGYASGKCTVQNTAI